MKKILLSVVVIFAIVAFGGSGVANAISEDLEGAISMNCASITGQLRSVRYYDRRAREYLGNRYERLVSSFVMNLNVRLVKNNISNMKLAGLQVELVSAQSQFKSAYGQYATEMDGLIGMNCVAQPADFYAKLEKVRGLRVGVRESVERTNGILLEFRTAVVEVRSAL